jgi:hypothetical protein
MGGGLINIISYGSDDLYLTGAPQITFYKMAYRRYTNFAMESVYLDFDEDMDFDRELELIPPRVGDLLHKAYLHVRIPEFSVTYQDVGIDSSVIQYVYADKSTVTDYEKIKNLYMNVMGNIYRIIFQAVNAVNVSYVGLVQDVQNYVNSGNVLNTLYGYDALLLERRQNLITAGDPREVVLDSTKSNLYYILTHINVTTLIKNAEASIDTTIYEPDSEEYNKELQRIMKNTAFHEINKGLNNCELVQQYFFDEYKKFNASVTNDRIQNIKCAWVKNLGHSIIDFIDVYIGGKRIDKHLGIWINIWYQLTYKDAQKQIYNNLIGDVASLNNFDKQTKPAFDLYIPLSFWFNKFNGLSFPLIAMQYNDVRFSVKLRKFREVFFIERIYKGVLNGNTVILTADMIDFIQTRSENAANLTLTNIEMVSDISLSDIWDSKGKQLTGHIIMDYVYLESPERKRFAQSGHEYLIERMQSDTFDNINQTDFDTRLDFTTPSKEIIWVFQKDIYTENNVGWNGCRWYDHAADNGKNNPVVNSELMFNNYNRVRRQVGRYFDKYQPMFYHRTTPTDGINLYSFCLDPLQHQPTGSCNFSKLTNVRLFCTLDPALFRYIDTDIYPYDTNINFTITINDPDVLNNLLESIDVDYANKIIRTYRTANNTTNTSSSSDLIINKKLKTLLQNANTTVFVHSQLSSGDTIKIEMDAYRRLFFKTTAKCHVFDLTMNILRLIGGYGALAYSGNN